MPITIKLARFLVSCGYIDYTEWELRREDREYVCNLDGKILTFHSLSHHYRTNHSNVYDTLINIISQRIVIPPDILILVLKQNITLQQGIALATSQKVVCVCGGFYKNTKFDKKQHELTQKHKKFITHNIAQQTLSIQT